MEVNTWLFFIFNCLVAVWIIAHSLFLGGKSATAGRRIILVAIGVTYGFLVIIAITQVEGKGSRTSPYSDSGGADFYAEQPISS